MGLRLIEQRKSEDHETGSGEHTTTTTESQVEANGSLFETLPFTEPAVPSTLLAGQAFECDFLLPAPRLGPPAAHLGEAIVARALEARWDVAMGEDAWVAAALNAEQNPDLIRAGVGRQGGLSMLDAVTPDGNARIELHRRITAPTKSRACSTRWRPPGSPYEPGSRPTSEAWRQAPWSDVVIERPIAVV